MNIHQIIQIGTFHTNHCEDFGVVAELGENKILCALMDGCTMGTDSHLASTLTGKVLRKIAKEIHYKEFVNREPKPLADLLKEITQKLFAELQQLKNQIQLEREELLCTLLLLILDKEKQNAEVLAIGDGLICVNGELTEYEQDNQPDYLGYHLNEDFDEWYNQQKQRLSLQNIQDISIATDGIFTFQQFDTKEYKTAPDLIQLLLIDKEGKEETTMFKKKLFQIEKEYGLKPTDDLGLIRLVL